MCLSGRRRKVGPVARVDLPPGHDRPLAAHLAMHALHHADEVVVISYQTSAAGHPCWTTCWARWPGRVSRSWTPWWCAVGEPARP